MVSYTLRDPDRNPPVAQSEMLMHQVEVNPFVRLKAEKSENAVSSENVGKKRNLRSFKLNRVYLDPLNMSNAGDFSWS